MNGQQLKNSILQMAVQGKLVPQDPNDEPASVLLERIRKEKEKLIKEGKIKKEKNPSLIFRGADNLPYEKVGNNEPVCMAEEVPFEIPDSWEWAWLKEIVYNRGQTKPTDDFCYIDIGSIDNKNQKLSTEENIISADKAPSRARKIVAIGDILYSTVRPYLHNMCIVDRPFSHQPIASTGFAVLACHTGFHNEFLFYYLMSPNFDAYANDTNNAKGVAYPAINDNKLYRALIPVPPETEQKHIVEKIRELLPYIETYKTIYSEAESLDNIFTDRLKKSILQEAVQGKLVPQDPTDEPASVLLEHIRAEKQRLIKEGKIKKDKNESIIFRRDNSYYEKLDGIERCIDNEIPFVIPDSWQWIRLGNLLSVISDGTHKTPNYLDKGIPFLSVQNISHGYFDFTKLKYISDEEHKKLIERVKPKINDILFCRIGTLGKAIKNTLDFEFSIFVSIGLLRPVISDIADYIILCINSPFGDKWIQENKVGGGTHTFKINLVDIPNMLIPLPPLSEQKRIAQQIEIVFSLLKTL